MTSTQRWLRRLGIAVGGLIAITVMVPLMVLAALQNDQVRSIAVTRVLNDVNDELLGHVELDGVDGSLVGHAHLRGLRIYDERGALAADIPDAQVDFRLFSLLGRTIRVDEVVVHRPTGVVHTYGDGEVNWSLIAEPAPPRVDPFDWPVDIGSMRMEDGAVAYFDETAKLEQASDAYHAWWDERVDDLYESDDAVELRRRFAEGLAPESVDAFAEPRAPAAAWLSDLDARLTLRMRGHDIEVDAPELTGRLHTDIVARRLPVELTDTEVAIGATTVSVMYDELIVDGWLQSKNLTMGVSRPPLLEQGDPDIDPFDRLVIDLGRLTVGEAAVEWPIDEVVPVSPLHVGGDVIVDPEAVAVIAEIESDGPQPPIEVTARIRNYDAPAPDWEASVRARDFIVDRWIADPMEIPRLEASIQALGSGTGFEPDDLSAEFRVRMEDVEVDDRIESDLTYLAVTIDDGVVEFPRLGIFTPYLDLYGTGHVDPKGDAAFRVRTTASERHARLPGDVPQPTRADVAVDLEARFDPDAELLEHTLLDARASAGWDIEQLEADGVAIAQSSGNTTVDITSEGDANYVVDYDVDASGTGLRLPPYGAGSLRVTDAGRASIDVEADGFPRFIERFENDARVNATAIRAPEGTADAVELTVSVGPFQPGRRVGDARVDSRIEGLSVDRISARDTEANFQGTVDLSARDRVRIDGDAALATRQIDIDDMTVDSVNTDYTGELDVMTDFVHSPLRRIRGDLNAELSQISSHEFTADGAGAELSADIRMRDRPSPVEMVERFSTQGSADIANISSPAYDAGADRFDLTLKLRGTPDQPAGSVEARMAEPFYPGEQVEQITALVELDDRPRRGRAGVEVVQTADRWIRAETDFAIGSDYQSGEVSEVALTTPRTEWRSDPGGLLRWTGRRAEAERFSFQGPDQSLFVDGHFQPDVDQQLEMAVDLDFATLSHNLHLDEFVPQLPDLAGVLVAEASAGGTAQAPTFDLQATLQEGQYEDLGPFGAVINGTYADERLQVAQFDASAFGEEAMSLTASIPVAVDTAGNYDFDTDQPSRLQLLVHPRRLRELHGPFPLLNDYGIDGLIGGEFHWAGTIDRPRLELDAGIEDFQIQGEFDGDFVDLRDIDVQSRIDYDTIDRDGDGLDASLQVQWEDETAADVAVVTTFPVENWLRDILDEDVDDFDLTAELMGTPLSVEATVLPLDLRRIPLESMREENLAGTARLDLDLDGTVEDPHGSLEMRLENGGFANLRNVAFDLDTRLADQQAHFDRIELSWGGDDIFGGEGTIPLPIARLLAGEPVDDLPIDFQWELYDTQISRLSAIDYEFARIRGYASASVELGGSLRSPDFAARAGIYDTQFGDDGRESLEVEIAGANDRVAVDGAMISDGDPLVAFDGTAPVLLDVVALSAGENWQLPGELEARVLGPELDLATIVPTRLFSDHIADPEGLLDIDVEAEGTWEEPSVDGEVAIENGAVTLPEFARRFEDISGAVVVDDEQFVVDEFELHDGPSSVEVDGRVGHDLFVPDRVDLALEADAFNIGGFGVDFPVFVTADATADGRLLGEPGEIDVNVSGLDVVVSDQWDRALHSTQLDPDIIIIDPDRPPQLAEITDDLPEGMDRFSLDVNIVVERPAWVRHPVGQVQFMADLQAQITGDQVAMGGSVDTLSGDIEFLGRRFSIQESAVTFTGSVPPNPRLQLEAHHYLDRAVAEPLGPPSTGDPRIEFSITGTAEEPRLELRSDPAMTDTEILFVLMTGRPPDRTDVGRDEGVANQALAAVSGLFVGMLQAELAGRLPLHVVRLEPGAADRSGLRLELGRYITSDLFLSYRGRLQADDDVPSTVIRLEYHFFRRLMTEVVYTSHNEGELNLFWDVL